MRLVFVLHLVVYFASGVKLQGKAAKKIAEQKKHGKEGGKKKALMKGVALGSEQSKIENDTSFRHYIEGDDKEILVEAVQQADYNGVTKLGFDITGQLVEAYAVGNNSNDPRGEFFQCFVLKNGLPMKSCFGGCYVEKTLRRGEFAPLSYGDCGGSRGIWKIAGFLYHENHLRNQIFYSLLICLAIYQIYPPATFALVFYFVYLTSCLFYNNYFDWYRGLFYPFNNAYRKIGASSSGMKKNQKSLDFE